MIKLAMIRIDEAFREQGFKSKMLLQVHDELVFDVLKDELDKVKPVILNCMQTALALPNEVPTNAELGWGDNWLQAH
jgi:DNA polymerase-1